MDTRYGAIVLGLLGHHNSGDFVVPSSGSSGSSGGDREAVEAVIFL
jgi:hypothetical protein